MTIGPYSGWLAITIACAMAMSRPSPMAMSFVHLPPCCATLTAMLGRGVVVGAGGSIESLAITSGVLIWMICVSAAVSFSSATRMRLKLSLEVSTTGGGAAGAGAGFGRGGGAAAKRGACPGPGPGSSSVTPESVAHTEGFGTGVARGIAWATQAR